MKSNKMKAIVRSGYGSPDTLQLKEVVKPLPKANQVLIKIKAASVTRADAMMRTGKPYIGRLITGLTKPKFPIPGTGFAGEIEGVGADVTLYKVGDRLYGESISIFSTNAEYIVLPEDGVMAIIPNNITYSEAAPVCDGALTSMNFLNKVISLQKGQKILINGASGSLGTAAVQIAKYIGAEVTGVCSTKNLNLVKSLGAHNVIDYTKDDFTKSTKTYDVIYDTVGKSSFTKCKKSLTKNGAYITPVLGGIGQLMELLWTSMFGSKKSKFAATGMLPDADLKILFKELNEIIEAGHLKTIIDKTYNLEQTADAHRYIDEGHKRGNVVIELE